MKYIYSDIIPCTLNVTNLPFAKGQLKNGEEVEPLLSAALKELRRASLILKLERLEKLTSLLILIITDQLRDEAVIPPITITEDLTRAFSSTGTILKISDSANLSQEQVLICTDKENSVGVRVSKLVASARCPYFRSLFNSKMQESSENILRLPGVMFESICTLVQYIYTGKFNFDFRSVVDTFIMADRLGLPSLQRTCLSGIKENLSVSNAIYISAMVYRNVVDSPELSEFCFNFFNQNALKIFQKFEDIQNLDWDMFKVFLSYVYNFLLEDVTDEQNTVALQCEILRAVLHWLRPRCLIDHFVDLSKLNSKLKVILKFIHTSRVSAVDFAECLIHSGMFDKPTIVHTFGNMGVILEEERASKLQKRGADAIQECKTCQDWGYVRIPIPCLKCQGILSQLGFCSWCNSMGTTTKIGPPCTDCKRGGIVDLKMMFDSKLLDECIRIHIPAFQMNQQCESVEDLEL